MMQYKFGIEQELRKVDPSVKEIMASSTWAKIKVHGIPLDSYLRQDVMEMLADDITA